MEKVLERALILCKTFIAQKVLEKGKEVAEKG